MASGVAKQAGNWFLQELMEQRVAFGVRGEARTRAGTRDGGGAVTGSRTRHKLRTRDGWEAEVTLTPGGRALAAAPEPFM